jgi:hypothetical protein
MIKIFQRIREVQKSFQDQSKEFQAGFDQCMEIWKMAIKKEPTFNMHVLVEELEKSKAKLESEKIQLEIKLDDLEYQMLIAKGRTSTDLNLCEIRTNLIQEKLKVLTTASQEIVDQAIKDVEPTVERKYAKSIVKPSSIYNHLNGRLGQLGFYSKKSNLQK